MKPALPELERIIVFETPDCCAEYRGGQSGLLSF
jgi:hypothetical protein